MKAVVYQVPRELAGTPVPDPELGTGELIRDDPAYLKVALAP